MSASRFVSAVVGSVRYVEGIGATVNRPFDNCIVHMPAFEIRVPESRRAEVPGARPPRGWFLVGWFKRGLSACVHDSTVR